MPGSNLSVPRAAQRGFTLLIAVILASVSAAIGVALASIAYKSVRLSATAQASQYAFYTADTGLECALYADQQSDVFDYTSHAATPTMQCVNGSTGTSVSFAVSQWSATTLQFSSQSPGGYSGGWFPIDGYCARVTIYKTSDAHAYLYSEGISNCDTTNPRTLERGLNSFY